jgi:hypothetical protein
MTLRADINSAYDEIAPPAPQLEAQLRMLVATEARAAVQSPGRRRRWTKRLRGTMALVAALLVVLLVAAVLVGGRVWHDWSVFTNRPVPAGQIDPAQLAALEARPLHMPVVTSETTCPVGPTPSASAVAGVGAPVQIWLSNGFKFAGGGPAYAIGGSYYSVTSWGQYANVVWVTEPQVTGLVLIRGRDALNHELPLVYIGRYSAGAILGTDTINRKQVLRRAELVLDAGHHPATSGKSKWGVYEILVGIPYTMSGCHAFQVDGEGFSEVFVTHPG